MIHKASYLRPAEAWTNKPKTIYIEQVSRALDILANIAAIQLLDPTLIATINKRAFYCFPPHIKNMRDIHHQDQLGGLSDYRELRRVDTAGFAMAKIGENKLLIPIYELKTPVLDESGIREYFVTQPLVLEGMEFTSAKFLRLISQSTWSDLMEPVAGPYGSFLRVSENYSWQPQGPLIGSTLACDFSDFQVEAVVHAVPILNPTGVEEITRGGFYYFNPHAQN